MRRRPSISLIVFLGIFGFRATVLSASEIKNRSKEIPNSEAIIVQKGDTLLGLSRRLKISLIDLKKSNPDLNENSLKPGQKIILPLSAFPKNKQNKELTSRFILSALPSSEVSKKLILVKTDELVPSMKMKTPFSIEQSIAQLTNPAGEDLLWPVETRSISSAWGPRLRSRTVKLSNGKKRLVSYRGSHQGLDLTALQGTNVYAALDGKVLRMGRDRKLGYFIVLEHDLGRQTVYGHHRRNLVRIGDEVVRGQKIAEVGRTGNATGPHLHFEYRVAGAPVNPLPYLNDEEEIPEELQIRNAAIGIINRKK